MSSTFLVLKPGTNISADRGECLTD